MTLDLDAVLEALGTNTIGYSEQFPDARLILAHCAISDLAWLAGELAAHPNVYIDTAWWHPADILGVFCLAPPGQVLWASDSPYGQPLASAINSLRCALEAGLTHEQVASVFGGQLERLIDGGQHVDAGPAPGPSAPLDPLLERVVAHLTTAMGRAFAGADPARARVPRRRPLRRGCARARPHAARGATGSSRPEAEPAGRLRGWSAPICCAAPAPSASRRSRSSSRGAERS